VINVAVVPVIDAHFAQPCLDSMADPDSSWGLPIEHTLVVDNTHAGLVSRGWSGPIYRDPDGHNLGVPRAWNLGVDFMRYLNADTLTLVSSSMLFGPLLHCTWEWQINAHPNVSVLEANGHSWHLITFHRRCFDLAGVFDGNFYPGYFEAIDFGHRLAKVGIPATEQPNGWEVAWCNAMSRAVARHSDLVLAPPLLDYYRAKWGGDKGEETFETPFGLDVGLDYWVDTPIPELAARYGLTNWW
jgi:hypothetical protein